MTLDSVENQLNQYQSIQNSYSPQENYSPANPVFKKKKNNKKILMGIIFILISIVGIISSFFLLGQRQDNRQQASVEGGLVNIKLQKTVDCLAGQSCSIDVVVNTGSSNIDALQAKVIFDQNSLNYIESISFKPNESMGLVRRTPESDFEVSIQGDASNQARITTGSQEGITFEENSRMTRPLLSLVKNEVSPNKEILLAWTLVSTNIPFNSNNNDFLLGRIELTTKQSSTSTSPTINMTANLDRTFSKATLYKTGQDSLNTPAPLTIALNAINVNNTSCDSDADCSAEQTCWPPKAICPEGANCMQLAVESFCKNRETSTPEPAPSTIFCQSDANCQSGEICSAVPAGGCPSITENGVTMMSACASRPYCRKAEGISCSTSQNCFTGYTCNIGTKTCEKQAEVPPIPTTTPNPMAIKCQADTDCSTGQVCYQPPMPTCPSGMACAQVMPAKICKDNTAVVTKTPTPVPTNKPTTTPISIRPSTPPISCDVPVCKNGVLRSIKQQYDSSRDYLSGLSCPIYACEVIYSCQYSYSSWSQCSYGVQDRAISDANNKSCVVAAPVLRQPCSRPCKSDSNCSKGESCVKKQVPQTASSTDASTISNAGYCSTTASIKPDLNGDGSINVLDLSIVIKNLFTNNEKADINKDNTVDISDYSLVLKYLMNKEVMYDIVAY